jgi:Fe-S-cluster containining protein
LKDFEFYKTVRLSKNEKTQKAFSKLHDIYNGIPDTKGCLDNISLEGGCNGWCCKIQTPQLLYSEFLLIWDFISKNWDDEVLCDLFEKCMRNAINDIPSKGCVFFDDKENLCRVHKIRPYNCRIYGITPPEEFNPRYEKLKEEYKTIIGANIKPQCELVSTVDNVEITTKQTDDWWNELAGVERMIGIPMSLVTDEFGGTYRTPHDHVLLYNMPENVLNALAGIKLYTDELDKVKGVTEIMSNIRNYFRGIAKK